MTRHYRRIVTGHNSDGKSTVIFDSVLEIADEDKGSGARQEDRAGAASSVTWVTKGFPVDNSGTSDEGLRKVNTAQDDGSVLRLVEYAPGVSPRRHRTNSVDYAVVMSGSIELELDTGSVTLDTGDILVQRGTIHNWTNNGSEPCLIAYILIGAHPVMIGGERLAPEG